MLTRLWHTASSAMRNHTPAHRYLLFQTKVPSSATAGGKTTAESVRLTLGWCTGRSTARRLVAAAGWCMDSARTAVVMDHYSPSQIPKRSGPNLTLSATPTARKAVMHRQSPDCRLGGSDDWTRRGAGPGSLKINDDGAALKQPQVSNSWANMEEQKGLGMRRWAPT